MTSTTALRCPVCKTDLQRSDNSYRCDNGHGFDIARQGYVNLLLSSQRPSKAPGDSAEMLADRRVFLDGGHYAPLRERVIERLQALRASHENNQRVLDLGCGEGYYTAALAQDGREVFALDIAKPALALAARRSSAVTWCVGTSRALPFHDHSLDVVLNIFCRPHARETQRVLREGGALLMAGPGSGHLQQLREILYDQVHNDDSHTLAELQRDGYTLQHSETLGFDFTLERAAIGQLARMTPHYWRAAPERRQRLDDLERLELRAEFVLQELAPLAPHAGDPPPADEHSGE